MSASSASRIESWIARGIIAFALLIATLHITYYFPRTVDDLFIFLRYAENIAAGHGPVYNIGERSEGFSSPLWVVMLALGHLCGIGSLTTAKLLGPLSIGALMVGAYRFSRRSLGAAPIGAALGVAAIAFNSFIIAWSVWGLETPLYLALLIWNAALVSEATGASSGRLSSLSPKLSRGQTIALAGVTTALALCRPEAPLFIAAIALGALIEAARRGELKLAVKRCLPAAGIVLLLVGICFAARLAYYGLPFPQTYYAKRSPALSLERVEGIWVHGGTFAEAVFFGAFALALTCLAWSRRAGVIACALLANLLLIAVARLEWMPSSRQALPIYIFGSCALTAFVRTWTSDRRQSSGASENEESTERDAASLDSELIAKEGAHTPPLSTTRRALRLAVSAAALGITVWVAVTLVQIDVRFSPFDHVNHGRGVIWNRPKNITIATDTWDALRRRTPDHVRRMPVFHHGMIEVVYRTIETDEQPLSESWILSRDIGRIGWLLDINVFDTAGLFTPAAVGGQAWLESGHISAEMVEQALERNFVLVQPTDGWFHPMMTSTRFRSTLGDCEHGLCRSPRRQPPSADTIRRRYQRAASKFPSGYYMMTLYGEAVGAAFEKRLGELEIPLTEPADE